MNILPLPTDDQKEIPHLRNLRTLSISQTGASTALKTLTIGPVDVLSYPVIILDQKGAEVPLPGP